MRWRDLRTCLQLRLIVVVATISLSFPTISEAQDKLIVAAHPSELSLFAADAPELAKLAPELRLTVRTNATYIGSGRSGRALIAFDWSIGVQEVLKRLAEADASDTEPFPRGVAEKLRDAAPRTFLEPAGITKLDELIVISDTARRSDVSSVGGLPIESRSAVGNFITLKKENGFTAEDILAVAREPSTKYVEPNYALELFGAPEPNDPRFLSGRQWGLTNAAFPNAWGAGVRTSTAVVAIIDTGMFYIHPDLVSNIWTNSGEIKDNLDNDGNGYIDDLTGFDFREMDGNPIAGPGETHSTQIAGVIGAVGNDGKGMTGAAWTVRIMPLRVFAGTNGDVAAAIKAIDYAIGNGANIINLSWGMRLGEEAVTLRQAISRSEAASVLIVAAAGNSGADIDKSVRVFPAGYTNGNIIAATALSQKEDLAKGENWASNYGATSIDLTAPGEAILSLFPGVGASEYDDTDDTNDDGTSLAAPYVTGAAALVWAQVKLADEGLSNTQIMESTRDLLLRNTRPLVALNGKTVTGGTLDLGFMAAPVAAAVSAGRANALASDELSATITGRLAIPGLDLGAVGTGALIQSESGPVQLDVANDKPLADFLRPLNGENVTVSGAVREEIQVPHGKVRILTPRVSPK